MVTLSSKTLALVISAIKELREAKGSTWREILRYVSSVYNIPQESARRQLQAALKRGVAYGILKKNGVYYSLPTDTRADCQEIASQELGLLDRYCRRKQRKKRRGCKPKKRRGCKPKKRRGARHSKRGMCKCKKRGRSKKRKRSRCKPRRLRSKSRKGCGCKKRGRVRARDRSMSPRSKIERLSLKATLESDKQNECENSSNSSVPSIERNDSGTPLSY